MDTHIIYRPTTLSCLNRALRVHNSADRQHAVFFYQAI